MVQIKFSEFFILSILLIRSLVNCDTLKALFVAHRHGDRTPVSTYKNDPYIDDKYWPDSWGQLTNAGKERMFNVGLFLRKKYDGFLTNNIREVQIRSSDKDRCIESTQLVVNGAYKPKDRWIWDENEKWLPVPVHTLPNYLDSMLCPSSECSAAIAEISKIYNSKYVQKLNENYKNLYKYLTLNCGEKINDIIHVSYIYDTLMIEKSFNYQIPVWATSKVLDQMKNLSIISFELMSFTRRIQRFRSGVFLYDLTQNMQNIIQNLKLNKSDFDNSKKKLFVYSSHDSFIAVLMSGLQIYNRIPPPFGSTLIFELHQFNQSELNWDESSSVKIFYLNETQTNNPYQLKIPACQYTDVCTVKQFISSISDLLLDPNNWNNECKDTSLFKKTLSSGNKNSI